MTISHLITQLEEIKREHGDLQVLSGLGELSLGPKVTSAHEEQLTLFGTVPLPAGLTPGDFPLKVCQLDALDSD